MSAAASALIYGLAVAGDAVAVALAGRGLRVVIADDDPDEAKAQRAADLGARWLGRPSDAELAEALADVDLLCPSPGVPETHRVIDAARAGGCPIRTEIDLAYEFEQLRPGGPRPILAVTGTDGKTTTTEMTAHLLRGAGWRAAAVGNTDVPFVAVLDDDVDVFVVECSSFRLNWLSSFRAEAGAWLNFAPDHLNWHRDLAAYQAAKARLWANVVPTDVAIGMLDDPVVAAELHRAACRRVGFGTATGDYRLDGETLVGPGGAICRRGSMSRDLPHDVTNALAAAALVIESGLATAAQVAAGLATFKHPPHRIEFVAEGDGVRWFNDSKATSPHAALQAIRSFDSIVLLAGGTNKNLDLRQLAGEPQRMRAVVALGATPMQIVAPFEGICPVVVAEDMADAVEHAAALARPGDVVLLSPGCASYDWYPMPGGGYPARGAHFRELVLARSAPHVAEVRR